MPSTKTNEFCRTEFLSFTYDTLYAPIFLICTLYGPTLLYVIFLSIKFHGWKRYFSKILEDPIYLIFPIFTNISFYNNEDQSSQGNKSSKENSFLSSSKISKTQQTLWIGLVQTPAIIVAIKVKDNHIGESLDIEDTYVEDSVDEDVGDENGDNEVFDKIEELEDGEVRDEDVQGNIQTMVIEPIRYEEPKQKLHTFSLYQSNVLYLLYVSGFSVSVFLDVYIQYARKGWDIHVSTTYCVILLFINIFLWLDFVREFLRKKIEDNNNQPKNWLYDTVIFSTNSLMCLILLPVWAIYRAYQR